MPLHFPLTAVTPVTAKVASLGHVTAAVPVHPAAVETVPSAVTVVAAGVSTVTPSAAHVAALVLVVHTFSVQHSVFMAEASV